MTTFDAIVCTALEGPDALRLQEVPRRPLGSREVRLRVLASGINFPDLLMTRGEYQHRYSRETDADKRYEFLTELRKRASTLVTDRKAADVKNWKQPIYYELMDVQSLKLRFGDLTFDIRGILSKYNELIFKYRKDPEIGLKVQELEVKLNALNDTFDQAFDPTEYINSATRMYLVN